VIANVLEGGNINLTFRRNFDVPELLEWGDLDEALREVVANAQRPLPMQKHNDQDTIKWTLTSHEQFTTTS
jgi:hypothetical protein